jgi:hypothetical protein
MEEEAVESRKKWLNEYLNKLSIYQISLCESRKQLGKSGELKDIHLLPLAQSLHLAEKLLFYCFSFIFKLHLYCSILPLHRAKTISEDCH